LALSDVDRRAERPGDSDLSLLERELARNEKLAAEVEKGNIVGDGGGDRGKNEVERFQTCFNFSSHDVSNRFLSGEPSGK